MRSDMAVTTRNPIRLLSIIAVICVIGLASSKVLAGDCVILLHGLARTSASMDKMHDKLSLEGMTVVNIDYPSRTVPIEELAQLAIGEGIQACAEKNADKLNFVTHSLGGILVRQYFSVHKPDNVRRVVMLGPPNKGSEVVDNLKDIWGFEWLNGPAGMQLGTSVNDVPKQLGPVNFELGVIAGTRSINWFLSTYLPNPDDGKVSVESTKVEGMCSFTTVPTSHPFIMKNDTVIEQVIGFLNNGKFTTNNALNHCAMKES